MKVSFIIPAYNVEAFLPRCLDSLAPLLDMGHEALLVDDGSTDSTLALAQAFAREHTRLKVVSQANAGQSAARNVALRMATGDYVWFVDADDYLDTAVAIRVLEATNDGRWDAVVFGLWLEDGHHGVASPCLQQQSFATGADYFRNSNYKGTFRTYPVNKLFRLAKVRELHLFFPEGRIYEDLQFNLEFFAHCGQVVQLPLNPYHYVLYNAGSSTSAKRIQERDLQALTAAEEATVFLRSGNYAISAEDTSFQTLVFSFLSSCLLRKYIPLSFTIPEAKPFVEHTMQHPLFRKAVRHCALHPSIGLQRWGMALCIWLSPKLSRHIIRMLMR